jgi:hypothetical protein
MSQENSSPAHQLEENDIKMTVNTQIGCRAWQNLDSTSVAELVLSNTGAPLKEES